MRRALASAAILAVVLTLVSCSDDDEATPCGTAQDLAASVQALAEVNLAEEGTSGVESAVDDVAAQWEEFDEVTGDRLQDPIDALGDAISQLEDAVGAVSGDDLGGSLTEIGESITAVADAWGSLAATIRSEFSTCELD